MLYTSSPKLQREDGVIEGSFNYTQTWGGNSEGFCHVFVQLGDRESGPFVALFALAPGCDWPDWRTGTPVSSRAPAHSHRTDTFRMAIADQPKQFKDGSKWMGDHDFLVMAANEVYVEQNGADGLMMFNIFADRRGFPHGYDSSADPPDLMTRMWTVRAAVDGSFPVHLRDEDAVIGVATSFAEFPKRRPRLFGSMSEDADWTRLSDGSTIDAIVMSDPTSGPMVLLSNNAPGAVEAPAGRYASDLFRMVVKGNLSVGDRSYGPHQFRATGAGVEEAPVVHGPEGSTQALLIADRRGWLPVTEDGAAIELCPRLGEVAAVVAPFVDSAQVMTVG